MGSIFNIIEKERHYASIPYTEVGSSNFQKFSTIVDNAGLMGCQGQPWCATYQFALEIEEFGKLQALKNWNMTSSNYCGYSVFETRDKFEAAGKTGKVPKIGALVIFSQSHIGRVLSINERNRTFECGEGNTSNIQYDRNGNACAVKTYSWNNSRILCFCYIDYDINKEYLSIGDVGDDVKRMQEKLIACGFSCGSYGADGDFGSGTDKAVKAFQASVGIKVDGCFGKESSAKLEELYKSAIGRTDNSDNEFVKVDAKENVKKGQEYLNNTYSTTIIAANRRRIAIDGIYGGESRNAAVAVWKQIANNRHGANLTISNINFLDTCKIYAAKMFIKIGDTKDEVYLLKFVLSGFGYFNGAMNRTFDKDLEKAVKAWQTAHKLEVDGICGAETWYSIFNDLD